MKSSSSIRNLLPRSVSSKRKSSSFAKFFNSENTPPPDPNIQFNDPPLSASIPKSSLSKSFTSVSSVPAPSPVEQPLKKEVVRSDDQSEASSSLDQPVKVVVRIRPVHDHERQSGVSAKKISSDSVSIGERKFTFDTVLDSNSNQEDVFQLVGVPSVKSALAGYNTSILSFGETGSGKTYTLWGPQSAMVTDLSPSSQQGIVPRIFELLFSEIQKAQESSEGKQINYQCRCSFLEIYNDQISDLLDPVQRNLEIRNDPRNGQHVENLTEEYVSSYEDVTQILIKGLSSRKVGATSINSKSSRSHVVFSFTVELWCKEISSKISSSKLSRITIVDLAGLDKAKPNDADRLYTRECKHVKKSLSQLGQFVNTLVKGNQTGKSQDALYGGCSLTRVLQDSLGGNSKLTVICNINSDNRHNAQTLKTLRFGQCIKSLKNEPVMNEISEDDVNDLSDQIRQLKDELIRAKSDAFTSVWNKNGYFKGKNARDSLNQLRVSLNRSLMLPCIENDSDNEVTVGEDDVRELQQQLIKLRSSFEDNSTDNRNSSHFTSVNESFETDFLSEDEVNGPEQTLDEEVDLGKHEDPTRSTTKAIETSIRSSISISLCQQSQSVLQEPTLSESPKIGGTRRSMILPPTFMPGQNDVSESANLKSDVMRQSVKSTEQIRSSLRSSKMFPGPTESLAASLQRGLEIIDHHQRNSASIRSSVAFSFEHLALKPCPEADELPSSMLCVSCKQKLPDKDEDNYLAEAQKKENELKNTNLVDQHKLEKDHLTAGQKQISNNQIILFEESKPSDQQKLPEIIEEKYEIKEVQEVYNPESTWSDTKEKEALLQEIQTLRSQLKSYTTGHANKSIDKLRSSLLAQSIQFKRSLTDNCNDEEELERERQRWTEMESEWISITEDLRIDLESSRRRAEKAEFELGQEKKCTLELDDALSRAVLGHARMVEHYADLQEKYNDLVAKHRAIMEGIAEVKKAAAKAGNKGGTRFAKSLTAELSALRVEREKEKEFLKKENKSLKIQLRDTAEAVHAAGELLVRLREAEHAASTAEGNFSSVQQENEKLKKQIEKLKRKHKMEMITMKQYMAESKLPESALKPLYREDSEIVSSTAAVYDDDEAWRAEFGAIYQDHL